MTHGRTVEKIIPVFPLLSSFDICTQNIDFIHYYDYNIYYISLFGRESYATGHAALSSNAISRFLPRDYVYMGCGDVIISIISMAIPIRRHAVGIESMVGT